MVHFVGSSRKDLVNCVQDTADFLHLLAVLQLVAKLATRGPAGGHCRVGRNLSHLGEVHLGEVLKERVDIAARSVGRGGLLPGRKVLLVFEHQASNVPDEEPRDDWFGPGVSGR